MNFKRSNRILEVGDEKKIKMLQTPCKGQKGQDKSTASVGKILHRKKCELKEWVLTRYSFYTKPKFDLEL